MLNLIHVNLEKKYGGIYYNKFRITKLRVIFYRTVSITHYELQPNFDNRHIETFKNIKCVGY